MTGESTVVIGLLLPDVLGTYSDAGNATVLAQRLRRRGIPAEVLVLSADSTPPATCDIYLLGGGENTAQLFAADWLRRHTQLRHALLPRPWPSAPPADPRTVPADPGPTTPDGCLLSPPRTPGPACSRLCPLTTNP